MELGNRTPRHKENLMPIQFPSSFRTLLRLALATVVVLVPALVAPAADAIVLQPVNDGFESGNSALVGDYFRPTGVSSVFPVTSPVHSGTRAMRIDPNGRAITTNPVQIPATATEATLDYFLAYDLSHAQPNTAGVAYRHSSAEPWTYFAPGDFLEGGQPTAPNTQPMFAEQKVNLLPLKGQTVYLGFNLGSPGGLNRLFVDDASVTITVPGSVASITQPLGDTGFSSQLSRQNHSDNTSACGVSKSSAPVSTNGNLYAAPGILNRTDVPMCVRQSTQVPCLTYTAAYNDRFDPQSVATNFLTDSGGFGQPTRVQVAPHGRVVFDVMTADNDPAFQCEADNPPILSFFVSGPDTSLDSAPQPPPSTTSPDPEFRFSSGTPGSTFECAMDDAPFESCTSPKRYSNLPNGSHTFEVRAVDANVVYDRSPAVAHIDVRTPHPAEQPPAERAPNQVIQVTQVTPRDTQAPEVGITGVPKTLKLKSFLRGVTFTVGCNEECAVDGELLGAPRSVRLAASYNLTLGSRSLGLGSGARKLTIKPSKRLIGKAKKLSVRLRVVATDASGNRVTKLARFKVK
jgi:hypothetical protein